MRKRGQMSILLAYSLLSHKKILLLLLNVLHSELSIGFPQFLPTCSVMSMVSIISLFRSTYSPLLELCVLRSSFSLYYSIYYICHFRFISFPIPQRQIQYPPFYNSLFTICHSSLCVIGYW